MAKLKPTIGQPVPNVPTVPTVPEEPSYFHQRIITELGVTPELNRIKLKFDDLESNTTREVEHPIFSEDEAGNIRITPFTIRRELIQYDNEKATPTVRNINNSRRKTFYVTRLKTPETFTDKQGDTQTKKYNFPKGAETVPFFPPQLCDLFERGAKIETLILTEGYFKAFKGAMCGLNIVGLSSISHYKEKETQTMYTGILQIIEVCQVENIILLYDGDCRNISLKDLDKKRDLRRRPEGFINSARNVRELLKDAKVDIYFASINSADITGHPKGLDDLYCALPADAEAITRELTSFSRTQVYFHRHNIKFDVGKLYKWFNFDSVENFRAYHAEPIGNREFNFYGTIYQYNLDKGNCTIITPGEAANYFRVGDDYYKYVSIPNKYQQNERKFLRRLKSTISEDHPTSKGHRPFISHVPKYEAFCNVPDHVNFQPVINNCFNIYAPFQHEPEAGDFETIKFFLNHIFSEQIEYGLDYIQLLYQRPAQTLPILCLVSKENTTGKSTFIKFIKAIFGQNVTVIGNEDLANGFNAFWVAKLIIAIEETFIDKKSTTERVKALATADKITMNAKGRDQVELDFFGKFILASNNEDNFVFATKEDERYWVRKIPKFTGPENANLLSEMINEIPAFLDFLNQRKMVTARAGRMWFTKDLLKTEALTKLIQNSRPGIEKEIYEYLKTIFFEFGESEVLMAPKDANELFLKRKQDNNYLGRIFRENMHCNLFTNHEGKEVVKAYSIPYWFADEAGDMSRREHKFKGRPFVFKAEDILDKPDLILWCDQFRNPDAPTAEIVPIVPIVPTQTTIFDQPPTQPEEFKNEDLPF